MTSQLNIRINGQSIQNIAQYVLVYNAISDWVTDILLSGYIMVTAKYDPSLMTFNNKGK